MSFSEACVNAEADAVGAAITGGVLRLYAGRQPATADAATRARLLAELRLGDFPPAKKGIMTAGPIADAIAVGTGDATWGRVLSAEGEPFFDGEVGAHIRLRQTAIMEGARVTCEALVLIVSRG